MHKEVSGAPSSARFLTTFCTVAYDVNKDGYRIAVVTLVKSAYRLGDTVNLAIALNLPFDEDRSNSIPARVYRIAVRLETHELIETSISMKSAEHTRATTTRLHAEHHEVTLDSGRVGCSLAIPSGATPDFSTSGSESLPHFVALMSEQVVSQIAMGTAHCVLNQASSTADWHVFRQRDEPSKPSSPCPAD